MIPLGLAMKLSRGYEAYLLPRGSTLKKYGVIMINSMGVIDNAYEGNDDIWHFPALVMCDGKIAKEG